MDSDYDDFGNYIGAAIAQEPVDEAGESEEDEMSIRGETALDGAETARTSYALTVRETKLYPEAEEVYGKDVEVRVEDEDTQALSTPIIAPNIVKNFNAPVKKTKTQREEDVERAFFKSIMNNPRFVRCVALAGHLHHGKTTFMDYLMKTTGKYTDVRIDEQQRGLSIKCTPVSLVLQNSRSKSYIVNLCDVPGHINLLDEAAAAYRMCDGVCIVVDAVEGVMVGTEKLIKHAINEQLPICVLINKVERLILELKLEPSDAFIKLRYCVEEINAIIAGLSPNGKNRVSPELGNVAFASSLHRWCFTCKSFAQMYAATHYKGLDIEKFARVLWKEKFIPFILEPLYKIYSHVVGDDPKSLTPLFQELGIYLKRDELKGNVNQLLTAVLNKFLGDSNGFVDMLTEHIPSPLEAAELRAKLLYSGSASDASYDYITKCKPDLPLICYVTKQIHKSDGGGFSAWGRVMSGSIRVGQTVKVLGEAYSVEDEEDMSIREVTALHVPKGRTTLELDEVIAGNWVLIDGVDQSIIKTATIIDEELDRAAILRPLSHATAPVMKIAVEPLRPQELPKMVEGLRGVNKTYPICVTKVEESGEHIILGTGELYMDSVMHDLRRMYADIEVKVADPVVSFCETVIETSSLQCFAETPNKKTRLTMIAEPLDPNIGKDIENKVISLDMDRKALQTYLQQQYKWDLVTSKGVWAFGPSNNGPNVLLDDTLSKDVDKTLLYSVKDSIVQGFQWGSREGPLCDEPIRNVKFRLLNAHIASEAIQRTSGQIIPTSRRVLYSSFLMATPRLMEPVYYVEIITPVDCISPIYTVLNRRRGHVTQDNPKPGSPLYIVKAFVPVIDSFGLETDIRAHTQGQAFCQSVFDHWSIVPGDPLDKSIQLKPLEPSPASALARDFMVKTRKRKGMSEDVSINKYFDDPMLLELAQADVE